METYEKKYEEALERCREFYAKLGNKQLKEEVEDIFPELAESEDKRMIQYFKDLAPFDNAEELYEKYGFSHKDAIAWLEKKCEQKLNVNDNAKEMFIKALERVEEQNTKGYKLTDCDKNSWWEDFKAYCGFSEIQKPTDKVEPKFKVGDFIQFKGMGHTRYTVKEVCGLSHYINTCNKRMDMSYTDANFELVEQKPAEWSEDDQSNFNELSSFILETYRTEDASRLITWLNDIKDRVQLQPKQEWSEEKSKLVQEKQKIIIVLYSPSIFVNLNPSDLRITGSRVKNR